MVLVDYKCFHTQISNKNRLSVLVSGAFYALMVIKKLTISAFNAMPEQNIRNLNNEVNSLKLNNREETCKLDVRMCTS